MTLLTHTGNRFKPASYSSGQQSTARATPVGKHREVVKRFCRYIVAGLLVGGAVAGIIALKTAAYFWCFPY